MRIGIDIDDTITNTWENSVEYHSSLFGIPVSKLKERAPYYLAVKEKATLEEYFDKISSKIEEVAKHVPLKPEAKEIINKLKDEGHTIVIITARSTHGYKHPYEVSKEYLDKNGIKYDKLVIGMENKGIACKNEKIDLFIDDSIKHCTYAASEGINVILYETYYNKNDTKFKHAKDWYQIYDYIKDRCQDEQ